MLTALLLWTVAPLLVLHGFLWRRSSGLLRFQLALDILLVVVVGPAVIQGADLNPVRCLERNRPFTETVWSGTTEYQPTQSDLVLQFHPWWEATREHLLAGRLPLIAGGVGGGLPLLANGQTGFWAPVMMPVWALGVERGTTVMAMWKLELAGLGAFLLLWKMWRVRWAAAAVGGIAYAGGAYQVAWLLVPLTWVTALLPWLWWMAAYAMSKRAGWRAVVGLGVASGWLLGSGLHPETAAIVVGSACLSGLILHRRRWLRLVVACLLALAIGLAMAWPTIGYIGASSRLDVAREQRPNLQPVPAGWRGMAARQLVLPAVNGHPGRGDWRAPFPHAPAAAGVGGLALAMVAVGSVRRRYRGLLWAAWACFAVATILYLRIAPIDTVLVRLPPFDRMTLPRFAALVPWALALWSALALDGALAGRRLRAGLQWLPVSVLGVVAVVARPWVLAPVDGMLVVLTVVAAIAAPLLLHRTRLLVSVLAVELACYAVGINPVAAVDDRLPRSEMVERLVRLQSHEGGRLIGVDGVLPPNLARRYGLADLRAYDPLRPRPFARMFQELGQTEPVLGGAVRQAPPGLSGAWSVRFLASGPDRRMDGWEPVWHGREGRLWRNPRWLPEVRVVGRTVVGDWGLLVSDGVDHETTAVVVDGSPPVAAGRVGHRIDRLSGSKITVTTDCDGPCMVVAARPWAPGWSATVDGEPAALVRANLAGLGAVAPAGNHRVELSYRPWRWGDGVP